MKKTDVLLVVLVAIFIWLFIVKRDRSEFFETPKFIAKPINWWMKKFDTSRGLNASAPAPSEPSNTPAPSIGQPLPELLSEITTPSSVPASVPAEPHMVPIPMI